MGSFLKTEAQDINNEGIFNLLNSEDFELFPESLCLPLESGMSPPCLFLSAFQPALTALHLASSIYNLTYYFVSMLSMYLLRTY